ncbi:unnamed protein product [Nesidiocoris tenuis]|uniref:Uncharacterized protein n=1 Tax=Nesidiocoris tenuis TaxID=355587 RepID=A0A6H5HES8_9HEMI|nr:unnamed protein product [Nesidiocoris tenuis]
MVDFPDVHIVPITSLPEQVAHNIPATNSARCFAGISNYLEHKGILMDESIGLNE